MFKWIAGIVASVIAAIVVHGIYADRSDVNKKVCPVVLSGLAGERSPCNVKRPPRSLFTAELIGGVITDSSPDVSEVSAQFQASDYEPNPKVPDMASIVHKHEPQWKSKSGLTLTGHATDQGEASAVVAIVGCTVNFKDAKCIPSDGAKIIITWE